MRDYLENRYVNPDKKNGPEKEFNEADRELIIHYFYNNHNNRDKDIAKKLGFKYSIVRRVLNEHLDVKVERINKREYKDIIW